MPDDTLTTGDLPPMPARHADPRSYTADPTGPGFLTFAGIMLLIVGVLNVIHGIAAIDNSKVFVRNAEFVLGDLKTWGWVMLLIGALQVAAAFAIWAGNQFGRWFGVLSAGGNAILQLLAISSYPFLSLSLFALDMLIIWSLLTFGGRSARA